MGMKFSDKNKILIKNYKEFRKKQTSLKTFPRCSKTSVEVEVMDSLNAIKKYRTDIAEIGKFGRHGYGFVVTKIKCPFCKEELKVDKRWLGFICSGHGARKIWEVVEVYEEDGQQFR